jgi:hypothetical protein
VVLLIIYSSENQAVSGEIYKYVFATIVMENDIKYERNSGKGKYLEFYHIP